MLGHGVDPLSFMIFSEKRRKRFWILENLLLCLCSISICYYVPVYFSHSKITIFLTNCYNVSSLDTSSVPLGPLRVGTSQNYFRALNLFTSHPKSRLFCFYSPYWLLVQGPLIFPRYWTTLLLILTPTVPFVQCKTIL